MAHPLPLTMLAIAILIPALAAPARADHHAKSKKTHVVLTPEALSWKPGPAALPPGAQMVLLSGDPAKKGLFAMRLRLPDGYRVPPHWHPADENVTVLSGTFLMGGGEKWDEAAARVLPAGSYTSMPKGMRHFAGARGETIIQLHGQGPWGVRYVNPADDPRKKK